MKKHSIVEQLRAIEATRKQQARKPEEPAIRYVVGIDVGDKESHYCFLEDGVVALRGKFPTTRKGMQLFADVPYSRVIVEVGTHSRWVSEALKKIPHEVIVANAREIKLIHGKKNKSDRTDPEKLARLGHLDVQLLHPIRHRSRTAHLDLQRIRVRAELVECRTKLVNCLRGQVKSMGYRLAAQDPDSLSEKILDGLPAEERSVAQSLVRSIMELTKQIKAADRELKTLAEEKYAGPLRWLRQVPFVGTLTALTFYLTIEDPSRFSDRRDIGAYLGLTPGLDQSGEHNPQLSITKEGDRYLRSLLVEAAHSTLSKRGAECDLKQWGTRLAGDGKNKSRKKKAVVAVARRLAVILCKLWQEEEEYDPWWVQKKQQADAAKAAAKRVAA